MTSAALTSSHAIHMHTHRATQLHHWGSDQSGQWHIVYLEKDWLYVRQTHTHTHTHTHSDTVFCIHTHLHDFTRRHSLVCAHTGSAVPARGIVLQ